jgi:hypothetical protein
VEAIVKSDDGGERKRAGEEETFFEKKTVNYWSAWTSNECLPPGSVMRSQYYFPGLFGRSVDFFFCKSVAVAQLADSQEIEMIQTILNHASEHPSAPNK